MRIRSTGTLSPEFALPLARFERSRRRILSAPVRIALLLFVAACDIPPTAVAQAECDDTTGQQVLALMNAVREEAGLPPLTVDVRIVDAARRHSDDMATNNTFGHAGSDGSNAGGRVLDAGYDWTFVAENVAAGQSGSEAVMGAWMNSPGHRANILSASARHVGVGYAFRSGTQYGHYWTVNFGATAREAVPPRSGCHP